ncbi:MAG: hypothetical protein ACRYG2_21760 [Janthinobacterium lividum]
MRGQPGPELTDDDLRRLVRLGGDDQQIAEASGLDPLHVRRRLARDDLPRPSTPEPVGLTEGLSI